MSVTTALAHGYKARAAGPRRCANCWYAGALTKGGLVRCRMFDFLAEASGVCREWKAER